MEITKQKKKMFHFNTLINAYYYFFNDNGTIGHCLIYYY